MKKIALILFGGLLMTFTTNAQCSKSTAAASSCCSKAKTASVDGKKAISTAVASSDAKIGKACCEDKVKNASYSSTKERKRAMRAYKKSAKRGVASAEGKACCNEMAAKASTAPAAERAKSIED